MKTILLVAIVALGGMYGGGRRWLGPELVTNGGFSADSDWEQVVSGTNDVTISGGVATFTVNEPSGECYIYQSISVSTNKTYAVRLTTVNNPEESFYVLFADHENLEDFTLIGILSNETKTLYGVPVNANQNDIVISPLLFDAVNTGTIDNVSVKELKKKAGGAYGGAYNVGAYQ